MSVEHHFYLGHFFDISPIPYEWTETYTGCPTCQKDMNMPFCARCGSARQADLKRTETRNKTVYDLCQALGPDWEDYLVSANQTLGENEVAILNARSDLDTDRPSALDLIERPIPELSPKAQRLVAAFRERHGPDSIRVHYGFVHHSF